MLPVLIDDSRRVDVASCPSAGRLVARVANFQSRDRDCRMTGRDRMEIDLVVWAGVAGERYWAMTSGFGVRGWRNGGRAIGVGVTASVCFPKGCMDIQQPDWQFLVG
jgi:hypothetical protein